MAQCRIERIRVRQQQAPVQRQQVAAVAPAPRPRNPLTTQASPRMRRITVITDLYDLRNHKSRIFRKEIDISKTWQNLFERYGFPFNEQFHKIVARKNKEVKLADRIYEAGYVRKEFTVKVVAKLTADQEEGRQVLFREEERERRLGRQQLQLQRVAGPLGGAGAFPGRAGAFLGGAGAFPGEVGAFPGRTGAFLGGAGAFPGRAERAGAFLGEVGAFPGRAGAFLGGAGALPDRAERAGAFLGGVGAFPGRAGRAGAFLGGAGAFPGRAGAFLREVGAIPGGAPPDEDVNQPMMGQVEYNPSSPGNQSVCSLMAAEFEEPDEAMESSQFVVNAQNHDGRTFTQMRERLGDALRTNPKKFNRRVAEQPEVYQVLMTWLARQGH